jgi:hypothetical protein
MPTHARRQSLGRLNDRAAAAWNSTIARSEIMGSSTNRTWTGKSSSDDAINTTIVAKFK